MRFPCFDQGLAEVRINGKSGLVNRQGKIVVPPKFDIAMAFNSEIALVSLNAKGNWRPETYKNMLLMFDPVRLYSIASASLGDQEFEVEKFNPLERKYIWATKPGERNFGLLKPDGTWKISPRFWMVQSLNDERAIVCIGENRSPEQRCGAVDPEGEMAVPLRPWFLSYWRNGLGIARMDGKSALLDKSGNIVGGRYFDAVEAAWQGDISKVLLDGQWMGIDRQGKIVANPEDGRIVAECASRLKVTLRSGKFQILGKDGQPVLPDVVDQFGSKSITMSFGEAGPQSSHELNCDQPLSFKQGGKVGLVQTNGKVIQELPGVDQIGQFSTSGKAPFQAGKKWGLIDADGKTIIPPEYDRLALGPRNLFQVTKAKRRFWIDEFGKEQPGSAPEIDRTSFQRCPGGGRFLSRSHGSTTLWGLVDEKNNVILEPKYRAVGCFKHGLAWVANDARQRWCAVDRMGKMRDTICAVQIYPYTQTHSSPEKFAEDPYENSVLWTRAYLEFGAGSRSKPPVFKPDANAASFSISR